ncbi:MAG: Rpn family recombination-promoting nuclease/putative transposase [Acetatifactor sp.]|nr:Rpn family recombination-promoting nuclease/putative transposase [Acetatifactor sp.]
MGKYDDAMYRYLSDNDRFADLFNAVFFDGRTVVQGELLEDASERYVEVVSDIILQVGTGEGRPQYEKSLRDIRKRMRTGESFIVTAIENQNAIDYAMPWRIMRYDQMEYGRQIRDIISRRRAALGKQGSAGNWMKRLQQEDRLCPVYTICFYHGTEPWDGPRSLRDMMHFGRETEGWQDVFHDYGMTLFCAGEQKDLSRFGTDLKLLLKVLQLRQDKNGLLRLWSEEPFSHLDLETAETMAVMTDSVNILKKLEVTEEGGCNMCLAVEEMKRDWKAEGRAEGEAKGRAEGKAEGEAKGIIELGIEFGLSENDILARLQNKLNVSLQAAQEYMGMFRKMTV